MNKIKVNVNKSVILYSAVAIICFLFAINSIKELQYDAYVKGYQAGYAAYQETEN